eukprot:3389004-Pyramimonas_sp.AAC.1
MAPAHVVFPFSFRILQEESSDHDEGLSPDADAGHGGDREPAADDGGEASEGQGSEQAAMSDDE